jgi:hypothetical protein
MDEGPAKRRQSRRATETKVHVYRGIEGDMRPKGEEEGSGEIKEPKKI